MEKPLTLPVLLQGPFFMTHCTSAVNLSDLSFLSPASLERVLSLGLYLGHLTVFCLLTRSCPSLPKRVSCDLQTSTAAPGGGLGVLPASPCALRTPVAPFLTHRAAQPPRPLRGTGIQTPPTLPASPLSPLLTAPTILHHLPSHKQGRAGGI